MAAPANLPPLAARNRHVIQPEFDFRAFCNTASKGAGRGVALAIFSGYLFKALDKSNISFELEPLELRLLQFYGNYTISPNFLRSVVFYRQVLVQYLEGTALSVACIAAILFRAIELLRFEHSFPHPLNIASTLFINLPEALISYELIRKKGIKRIIGVVCLIASVALSFDSNSPRCYAAKQILLIYQSVLAASSFKEVNAAYPLTNERLLKICLITSLSQVNFRKPTPFHLAVGAVSFLVLYFFNKPVQNCSSLMEPFASHIAYRIWLGLTSSQ